MFVVFIFIFYGNFLYSVGIILLKAPIIFNVLSNLVTEFIIFCLWPSSNDNPPPLKPVLGWGFYFRRNS